MSSNFLSGTCESFEIKLTNRDPPQEYYSVGILVDGEEAPRQFQVWKNKPAFKQLTPSSNI